MFLNKLIKDLYIILCLILKELYIDSEMKCYEALQYKRIGFLEWAKFRLTDKWKQRKEKAVSMNIYGDTKGDGFQSGGALIVDKGGKQLYEFIQQDTADHISAEEIYKTFKITS
jgi:prostamide/prostaglandin F2alpha synthase